VKQGRNSWKTRTNSRFQNMSDAALENRRAYWWKLLHAKPRIPKSSALSYRQDIEAIDAELQRRAEERENAGG
jgi:hypothetical protein